jgi:N-acyl-phosphatidylethanolamine-hydrolysing phospholipase D
MDPDEAVRAHRELGAERTLGIHWGTFQLTDEAREQPLLDLEAALERHGVSGEVFEAARPGEGRWLVP